MSRADAHPEAVAVQLLFFVGFVAAVTAMAGALMGRASPLRQRAAAHGSGLSSPVLWADVFTIGLPVFAVVTLLVFVWWLVSDGR